MNYRPFQDTFNMVIFNALALFPSKKIKKCELQGREPWQLNVINTKRRMSKRPWLKAMISDTFNMVFSFALRIQRELSSRLFLPFQ